MSRQVILITGATSGIGNYTAKHLRARGHHVIGTGRNEKALAELRAAGIDAVVMDITSDASVAAAKAEIDALTKQHGLDVLVNNAGYGLWGPVEMLTDEDVRAQYETNVFGLLRVTKAFLPTMRARGKGRVVNVSSVGGRMTFPLGGIYNSTKYAVESISDALRMEVKQFGIEVSLVEPGYIRTEFTARTLEHGSKYADDALALPGDDAALPRGGRRGAPGGGRSPLGGARDRGGGDLVVASGSLRRAVLQRDGSGDDGARADIFDRLVHAAHRWRERLEPGPAEGDGHRGARGLNLEGVGNLFVADAAACGDPPDGLGRSLGSIVIST